MTEQARHYWEDFTPGRVIEMGAREVGREEIVDFASRYDPQPFHLDDEAGRATHFGGLVASGWHTCAMLMRLMCDAYLLDSASLGSPGLDNVRWMKPVRPGDVLHARMTVLEARPSQSRPEMGLVRSRWEMFNQNGEAVLSMEGTGLFRRRPPA